MPDDRTRAAEAAELRELGHAFTARCLLQTPSLERMRLELDAHNLSPAEAEALDDLERQGLLGAPAAVLELRAPDESPATGGILDG